MIQVASLCALFAAIITMILLLSSQQPHSALAQAFHLFDCSPNCWLNIQPGKTHIQKAVELLIATFGKKDMIFPNGMSVEQEIPATFSGTIIQVINSPTSNPVSGLIATIQVEKGIVSEISLSSGADIDGNWYRRLPSLGELIGPLGTPTCLISLGKTQKLILNHVDGAIEVNFSLPINNLTQPVISLVFYKPGVIDGACRSLRWMGFSNKKQKIVR